MEKVKVKKVDLVKVLQTNRDIHQEAFNVALAGYKISVEKELKSKLKDLKAGKDFDLHIHLLKPISYVKQYNDVIGMLEISSEEEVSITMEEYLKYYKNEWEWQSSWQLSNAFYSQAYVDSPKFGSKKG
jgi:Sec7-like guanine-nucleotide exchange factor